MKLDLTKLYTSYYSAGEEPLLIDVDEGTFLSLEGTGPPGGEEFQRGIRAIYSVAYAVKRLYKGKGMDFAVPKLEALWLVGPEAGINDSVEWRWKLLIRMPEWVAEDMVAKAVGNASKRGIELVGEVRLERIEEGLCVQILHVGPYSEVDRSMERLREFMEREGLKPRGPLHEIYLSDPRRTRPSRLRTILRRPVARKAWADEASILRELESLGERRNVEDMRRYGIVSKFRILGVPKPRLREMAKRIGRNHELALRLWSLPVHEAKILATMIADLKSASSGLMDEWIEEVDNWDLCDQCVFNLFWRTDHAHEKAMEWSAREEEFVKRAGFALMAKLAISDKEAGDDLFERFLRAIIRESGDERKYVRKAVSWALRQIGKRNYRLNRRAIETAEEILRLGTRAGKKTASEALKELTSEKVAYRLRKRSGKGSR